MKSNVDASRIISVYISGTKPTILKNPSFNKLQQLIKNAKYNELKGLIFNKDVYWWNQVDTWEHSDMWKTLYKGNKPDFNPFLEKSFNYKRLTLMYINKKLCLVNAAGVKGVSTIVNNPYLKSIILEGDLWLDKSNSDIIPGRDYIEKGGSMTTANYIREKVHASVLANAAKERLALYKRLKNEKKV